MGDPLPRSAALVASLAIPDEDWPDLASDVLFRTLSGKVCMT
jgi:hypothetical protein